MNKYAEMMLRGRDGRNPYGSRGGYVVSSRRDRAMNGEDYGEDMARRYGYGRASRGRRDYDMEDPMMRDERYRDYGYDERDYRDYGEDYGEDYGNDYRRGGRRDYNDYGEDYRRGRRRGYRDYADYGEDYGDKEHKLKPEDMEKWKKKLHNEDGTKGAHFRREQVEQAARAAGVDIHQFGEDVFLMAVNMMYSDYCKVGQKFGIDRPEFYIELAKSFLDDKDFDGKGDEKLMLYYKCIVEEDE